MKDRPNLEQLARFIGMLAGRLEDESEYEDFDEYKEVAKQKSEQLGYEFVSLVGRPFALSIRNSDKKLIRLKVLRDRIIVEEIAEEIKQ